MLAFKLGHNVFSTANRVSPPFINVTCQLPVLYITPTKKLRVGSIACKGIADSLVSSKVNSFAIVNFRAVNHVFARTVAGIIFPDKEC